MSDLAKTISSLTPERRFLLDRLLREQGVDLSRSVILTGSREPRGCPLSFAQQRMWFLARVEPEGSAYNISMAVRVEGRLEVAALRRALAEVVRRHEVLRTRFSIVDGAPVQVIAPPGGWHLPAVDLSGPAADARDAEVKRLALAEAQLPFDLERGPLLRGVVLALDSDEHVLLLTMHHIVGDAWSTDILVREVIILYQAIAAGGPSPLPELRIQYADFAQWQRRWLDGEVLERQLGYWRRQLASLPALDLLTDRSRPAVQSFRGARRALTLPAGTWAELRALGRRLDATPFMVLLAVFQVLLQRYTGQTDIAVGSPIAGRNRPETEGLIGFFVNTLVLRSDLALAESFPGLLRQVRETTLDAYAHQDLPFERVVSELQPERSLSHNPLFQVFLAVADEPTQAPESSSLRFRRLPYESVTARFELALELVAGQRLEGSLVYATDLFDGTTAARMVGHFATLLGGIACGPEQSLLHLPLLSEGERHQLTGEWSDTPGDEPEWRPVHELFAAQAVRTPEATALLWGNEAWSYGRLAAEVDRLARELRRLGAGPEVPVGLCAGRSPQTLAAALAILASGSAFVPLDPAWPGERIGFMLREIALPVLVLGDGAPAALPPHGARVVRPGDGADLPAEESAAPDVPFAPSAAGDLAYMIYTSGSTGRPKAVMVEHASLACTLRDAVRRFGIGPGDVMLSMAPYVFDISLFEWLAPLLAGGTAVVLSRDEQLDPEVLQARARCATLVHAVPSLMRQMIGALRPGGPALRPRRLFVGGDVVPPDLLCELQTAFPAAHIEVLYGPTEAALFCTSHPVATPEREWRNLIGRPLAGAAVRLFDGVGNLAPIGVAGEIHLGGPRVSRGYFQRPELTAEKYVQISGQRFYRTGDLARWSAEGCLEFLGRLDDQVKIRGFRIEPGEIAAALVAHPTVLEAVVMARTGPGGERRLVAYVVPPGGAAPVAAELRSFLQSRVPDYMVPSAFVTLPELPLSSTGKVDRRALPEPERESVAQAAPRTEAEQALAGIWSRLLKIDSVGVEDNFFQLGGDSILGIQVISQAALAGLRLSPRHLYEHPTLGGLAAAAEAMEGARAEQEAVSGPVPLTPIQSRFFAQALPHPEHFNQALLLELGERAQAVALARAVAALLTQHDALRMRFVPPGVEGAGWRQTNEAAMTTVPMALVDLSALPPARLSPEVERAAADLQESLDLVDGPLLRAALLRPAGGADRLLLLAHHLVVDGVSWRILLSDLEAAYLRLARGEEPVLPPKTASLKSWAERLVEHARSPEVEAQGRFWLERLAGGRAPLPVDTEDGANDMAAARDVVVWLGAEVTRALLQEAPRAYRTRIDEVLLTALALALAGWSGSRRHMVDIEGHGREDLFPDLDVTRTVGWFTTVCPVLLDLEGIDGPAAELKAVKEQLRAVPDRGMAYGLLRELGEGEVAAALRTLPRAQVGFNYLGQLDAALPEGGLLRMARESSGPARYAGQPREHLLEVTAGIVGGRLRVAWSHSRGRHRHATVEVLAESFRTALEGLVAHCLSPHAGGFTPSDFPLAGLGAADLDRVTQWAAAGGPIEDLYPATPMQEGMLFHTLHAPGSGVYVSQVGATLLGELDFAAFLRAWTRVAQRHAALRTGFFWDGLERPLQWVAAAALPVVEGLDWAELSEKAQRERWEALVRDDRQRGFDLARPPLQRVVLARLGERRHRLLWSHHHALLDGWSLPIVMRELFAFYAADLRGEEPALDRPRPFHDYVAWLTRQDLSAAERFWRRELAGFAAPTPLGADHPAAAPARALSGASAVTGAVLPAADSGALQELARGSSLTLNTLVEAAWALLLHRHTGEDDVVFGYVSAGRATPVPGIETVVGLFVNTLPARVRIMPGAEVVPWLRQLFERQAEARLYEYSPLAAVQGWSDVPRGLPLFTSVVAFESYPIDQSLGRQTERGLEVVELDFAEQANYPLSLLATPGPRLRLKLLYDPGRFDGTTVERMLGHLQTLLGALAGASGGRLSDLPLLAAAERHQLLFEWSSAPGEPPDGGVLHWIAAQVERAPDTLAALAAAGTAPAERGLTYAGLGRRAGRLARYLRGQGVGPQVPVGLCVERSLDVVVGILGILAAGGAYVPLDPSYPRERLAAMIDDALGTASPSLLLTRTGLRDRFESRDRPLPDGLEMVCLDAAWETIAAVDAGEGDGALTAPAPHDLAYIIYTSGSTGRPKGVPITHSALARSTAARFAVYREPVSSFLLLPSFAFDSSVAVLFWTLCQGGTLVLPAEGDERDPSRLLELVVRHRVSHWLSVPSLYAAVLETAGDETLAVLRTVVVAGEACPAELVSRHRQESAAALYNEYGPTEATVWSTVFAVPAEPAQGPVPIGRAVPGARVYVLDPDGRPLPPQVAGELCIGGEALAWGYFGRPELTAERFVPDPFGALAGVPGARLYRTGDLVRHQAAGDLEFLGRVDHQIKIRGFRIEPGEIEAVLAAHPAVAEAAVVMCEDRPGDRRLLACVVLRREDGEREVPAARLRSFLAERLPDFMVPSAWLFLPALPRTPNGKVDRRELSRRAAAATPATSGAAPVPPRTPFEELLAAIFSEVLQTTEVGAESDFFELGGHSLVATRLVSRVGATFGVELPLRAVFETPTVAGLAAHLERAIAAGDGVQVPPIRRVERSGPLPLSFGQQRLWFLDRFEPGGTAYNTPMAVRVEGRVDVVALRHALCEVTGRHESLRTTFAMADGEPVQVIAPAASIRLPVVDLAGLPRAGRAAEVRRLVRQEARRPFDLTRGPLLRETLIAAGPQEHVLLLMMHHIVCDAWSTGVLVRELGTLYDAISQGRPSPLADLEIQYADFASWQRGWLSGATLAAEVAYWRSRLGGSPPVLTLPLDRPRPAVQKSVGASSLLSVPADVLSGLRALCRRQGVTLYMLLLAGYQALLSRHSGQQDVAVGTPIAGRNHFQTEGLIGFFINTLVMRTDLAGDPSFLALLERLREVTLGAYAHQDLPFEKLVEELQPERDLSHSPLFQVTFTFQNAPEEVLNLPGLRFSPLEIELATAKVDLLLMIGDGPVSLAGSLDYSSDLFDASTVARLGRHLQTLLAAVAAEPATRLADLPLWEETERHQILVEWNDSVAPPGGSRLHQVFTDWARRRPQAIALTFGDHSLTYGELSRRSDQLACHLRSLGVGPEVPVGVCVERSLEMVISILAIWKAGGAFLPLDPHYPAERLAFMVEDSGLLVLLTQGSLVETLPPFWGFTVRLDADWESVAAASDAPLAEAVAPEGLSYVIYTSGSTGRAKGVMVAHPGLAGLAAAQAGLFGVGPGDRILQFSSASFDASVWEVAMALGNGACLCLADRQALLPGPDLHRLLGDLAVTLVTLPPSALAALPPGDDLTALRTLIVAGEACPLDLARRWARGRRFVNAYGPTETTVCASAFSFAEEGERLPLGRPLDNTRIYLLDRTARPVPAGVTGELHVAGISLARGYLGRPELTAEAFVPNPFGPGPGARLYRTGDLARYLADGQIEFLGRADHQVKVRGFRIELAEVESALAALGGVREAAVLVREDAGGSSLVAYTVAAEGAALTAASLREALREVLPGYMVPAQIALLPSFPLLPNGKVDRAALARLEPVSEAEGERGTTAPRNPVEEMLVEVFRELLKTERVGVEDSFFDLGGHSLLATQLVSRLQTVLGVDLSVRAVFEAPTVAGLAALVQQASGAGLGRRVPPIERVSRETALPLSFAQQRLWFLDRLEPGGSAYNMPLGVRLAGTLDAAVLATALAEVVRRHEVLRTTFAEVAGEPVQVIAAPLPVPLPRVDLTGLPASEHGLEMRRLAAREALAPFDLARGPVLRATLLAMDAAEHVLLLTLHHIASDAWSMGLLTRELATLYAAFREGLPSPLAGIEIQYADFACWQRRWLAGEVLEEELTYWREQLRGLPPLLELPADRPRPAVLSAAGAGCSLALPATLLNELQTLSRHYGATLFMTLLAVFQVVLQRYSSRDDIAVGTPVAGRGQVQTEELIGFFLNTLVLRTDLSGDLDFAALLGRVREATLAAYSHQDVPFDRIVEELQPERNLSHSPLFQVMLNLPRVSGPRAEAQRLPGLVLEPLDLAEPGAKLDLTLYVFEDESGALLHWFYSTDLFDGVSIARMALHFEALLHACAAEPERPLASLPSLGAAERQQLLVEWNDTAEPAEETALHELVARQAERTPDAVALVLGEQAVSYGELVRRASRLAGRLRALGVGPEVRVGLCLGRSPEMVVAMLAVLGAGGAYVPLDPDLPSERLAYMSADSGAAVLLAGEEAPAGADPGPAPEIGPDGLAYIVYTSGSTGRPKGVLGTHRGAVSYLRFLAAAYGLHSGDRVLQLPSLAFDASIRDLVGPLSVGATVVLADGPRARDAAALLELAALQQATCLLSLVPTMLRALLAAAPGAEAMPAGLRLLLMSGERLHLADCAQARAVFGEAVEVINQYGPTECVMTSSYHRVREAGGSRSEALIGRPIANRRFHVLRGGAPVPLGAAGELHTAGGALTRGYLGRPDLTAEKFLPDPFSSVPGARMYATGDLVRRLHGGELEFLGRIDAQFKLRGFRVEPGEVEAVLCECAGVETAAVLVCQEADGSSLLTAFVVPRRDHPLTPAGLREVLRGRLPDYMVPARLVLLEALPITANGKVDRQALSRFAVAPEQQVEDARRAPRTPLEELVADLFAELLRRDRVGRDEDFFALGGHSLLATRLLARLRSSLGVEVPLRALFETPTVAAVAALAAAEMVRERGSAPLPPLERMSRDAALPLSFAQQRLWFLDRLQPGSPEYNVPVAVRLDGRLDASALAAALAEVVRRHEVLRTVFDAVADEPVQVVLPPWTVRLPVLDLAGLPDAARAAEVARLARREALRPFDLAQGPLLRAAVVSLTEAEHALLLTLHHIASDAWSVGLLAGELGTLYDAFSAGRPAQLPELAVQYADFACWQRRWLSGEVLAGELAYWRRRLAGPPPRLELPTDRPRPALRTAAGGVRPLWLDGDLLAALRALSRRQGATLFMTLLTAFQTLLARHSGQEDIAVGTPVAGRSHPATEPLIGFFVNTLVMRVDLAGDPAVAELLARVRESTLEAFAHQDVPFEKLVEELQPERDLGSTPLFQAMLILQNAPEGAPGLSRLTLSRVEREDEPAKFDLTIAFSERRDGLACALSYSTELFDGVTAQRLLDQLERVLRAFCASPGQHLSALPVLGEAETHALLVECNDSRRDRAAGEACLHQLFAGRAAQIPDAPAIVCNGECVTFGELDRGANRLARHLIRRGVGPEVRVGVLLRRSPDLLTALLGILKAGGAYVPLDPAYPAERLAFMLADAGVTLMVTEEGLSTAAPPGLEAVRLDGDRTAVERESGAAPAPRSGPRNLAYVIYTSGSTGRPKGVAIEHRSAVEMLRWAGEVFPPADLAGVLASTSICFDLSVFELFVPLVWGGTILLAENALALPALAAAAQVTLINTVPSAMAELAAGDLPPGLRTVNLAGEALHPALVEQVYRHPQVTQVLNLYGPSEDTTYSTLGRVGRGSDRVTIGRPVSNTCVRLLGRRLVPAPVGVPGELYLGGEGLARGYLGRPELTAERFVPDPFATAPGGRLYRTGDLARCLRDGEIEYLGRIDHQVKVRGFRIELGEVEAVLSRHSAVAAVAVLARQDRSGGMRLVACVAPHDAGSRVEELRRFLREHLPEHMVPSSFMALDALPLLLNGKVDRQALARQAPEQNLPAGAAYVAPQGPLEELLAGIFGEVLGHDKIGARDDFFALGGHSLLAMRLVSRLRRSLGIELPVRTVFEEPTVAGLAVRLGQAEKTADGPPAPPIERVLRDRPLPLSFAQQRLWFLDQLTPGSAAYNIPSFLRLEGVPDVAALAATLREIVLRHEVLRTSFALAEGQPVQVIAPEPLFHLPLVDLSALPPEARHRAAELLALAEARRPFDLARGPLLRAGLVALAREEHLALVTMHHIASDAWSIGVLVRELGALYESFAQGRPSPLPELEIQYADFACWQRRWLAGEALAAELAHWRQRLDGLPVLEMPTDRPRPAVQTPAGGSHRFALPVERRAALQAWSRAQGATLFMTLLAAFQALLSRWSGQQDLAVGTPVAGRGQIQTEPLIGFFVNTLVMRTDLGGGLDFAALVARVRDTCLEAYAHQDLPFEKLVEEMRPERDLSRSPLFQVLFILQNAPAGELRLPGVRVSAVAAGTGETAKFDLGLSMIEGGGLGGSLSYRTDLFDGTTTQRLAAQLERLLAAVTGPPCRLADLPWLAETERHQLLVEWGAAALDSQEESTVGELFERQAARAPDATAVVCEGEALSYGELNRRANQMARRLRRLGMGRGETAGLLVERSLDLPVGLLGIFKSGGVYLPLDPAHPRERLALLAADAGMCALVTHGTLADRLPAAIAPVLLLDTDREAIAQEEDCDPRDTAGPRELAYLLYTSGSTGRPKAVLVEHGSLAAVLASGRQEFGWCPDDVVPCLAAHSFDIFLFELLSPLLAGGRSLLLPMRPPLDVERLVDALGEATRLHAVPALMRQIVEAALRLEVDCPRLRTLFVGGDAVPLELLARMRQAFPRAEIRVLYGPTEATIICTSHRVAVGETPARSLLGRPLRHAELRLYDGRGGAVAVGVPGEIHIGGPGVTRGYLGREDLTAERFPMADGRPWYRSGDLARWLPDGTLEFLGRCDQQVKVRGYRVEPGEIEAALAGHPAVREALVMAREGADRERRLVAYLVVDGETAPTAAELRRFLEDRVPEYMVPSFFVILPELPLLANGKVDRKSLPAPEGAVPGSYTAPVNQVEEALAEIWRELLGVERVGRHDNFFDLGGHSLLIVQLRWKVQERFARDVPVLDLFRYTTVSALAEHLSGAGAQNVLAEREAEIAQRQEELQQGKERIRQRLRQRSRG